MSYKSRSLFLFPFDKLCIIEADCESAGVCNPVQCLRAASQVCTIVCGWKKKKKEREQKKEGEEKKLGPFVWRGPSRKAILQLLQLAGKASSVALSCTQLHAAPSRPAHCLHDRLDTLREPTATQGFCPDDESRRQTGPWILMRRESAS